MARSEAGGPCVAVRFVDGGKSVLAATADGRVGRWDAETLEKRGETRLSLKGVLWVGTRDDEGSIAVGLADGTVRVCDGETGEERSKIDVGARESTAIALAPDARLLATGGADGRVLLWWAPTRTTFQEIPAHSGPITSIAFSADGRFLTTAGDDRVWRVWEVATGGNVVDWDGPRTVGALAFHPRAWRIAKGMDEDIITGYTTGGRAGAGIDRASGNIRALAFSPDGRRLFSVDEAGTIEVWDTKGMETLPAQARDLGQGTIGDRWVDLGSSHATSALRTMELLLAHADEFIAYASEREKPVHAEEAEIRAAVKGLSDELEVGWAVQELEMYGEAALPYLVDAPDGEEKRLLLETAGKPAPRTPSALRAMREVQILEALDSEKARALLETWAGGHPLARLTQDARAALRRLHRR